MSEYALHMECVGQQFMLTNVLILLAARLTARSGGMNSTTNLTDEKCCGSPVPRRALILLGYFGSIHEKAIV
ncbi:MAG: hypothetical protein NTW14_09175 [bacterium]|nr:hypothetical protein [bacterium]